MSIVAVKTNYWTLSLTTSTYPVYNYKFVVDIYIDSVKVVRLKQPRNEAGAAHINYERIVKDYVDMTNKHSNTITGAVDYDSIHLIPQNTTNPTGSTYHDYPISDNDGSLKLISFEFSEEYASTEGGVVSIISDMTTFTLARINYADDWEDAMLLDEYSHTFVSPVVLGDFLTQLPSTTDKPNDTNGLIPVLTSFNDYKTFAWFNEYDAYFSVQAGYLVYHFFKEAPKYEAGSGGSILIPSNHEGTITVDINANTGGIAPASANSQEEYLLFGGVGGGNVKNIKYFNKGGYQLAEGNEIKYYTAYYGSTSSESLVRIASEVDKIRKGDYILIYDVSGGINWMLYGAASNMIGTYFYSKADGRDMVGTGAYALQHRLELGKKHLFEIAADENCNSTRFEEYTLAWKNKFGVWDYYLFDGEHSEKRSYKRKTSYERQAGTWNEATYTLNSYERGKVDEVTGTKQVTINTRYISDEFNDFFNSLLMSNEVQLLSPVTTGDDAAKAVPVPINIKDSGITYKTNLKDKLVQYSFTFEYAHNLKRRY